MDIQRFTLTAIFTAILSVHAETASAVNCPPQIVGTALAGQICQLVGSNVTVENGGVVGGILMTSLSAPTPSFITVNAGGLVNAATGVAITVSNSSLSNGLSNSGTISSGTGTGIVISNGSIIAGGLTNTGTISTGALGIRITQSVLDGDLLNKGSITSANEGTGILIDSTTLSGNLSNSGMIAGSGNDSGISLVNNSVISGDFMNKGLVTAENGNGILMRSNTIIHGNISNSGTIKSTAEAGISIMNSSTVQGSISNSGTISGGTVGLSVHNLGTVGGNITNSGTIQGGVTGLSVFSATHVNGGISNSGVVSGGQTGILISSTSTVSGSLSNSGTIQGSLNSISVVNNSTLNNINMLGQNARVIGAVNAVTVNFNITSGAIFASEGTFNVNNFNVASNAIFNMANTVTVASSFNNAGTVVVPESLQTISGNYTQNTGGVFQTNVLNAANYGALAVTGNADLSASGYINVHLAGNSTLHAGDVLSNVISGGTLASPVNGYQVTDNSFIWKFLPISTLTGVSLVAIIDPIVPTVCEGNYCQGASNVIIGQVAAGNSAFAPFTTLASASAFQTAVSEATPELTNENLQVTQLVTRSVMDVVPMWGVLHGKSAGDAMLADSGKIWLKPYGATINQNKSNSVNGYHASALGFVVGKDVSFGQNGLLGGAFAIGKNNLRGKAVLDGQTINSDVYQALVYGAEKLPHHFYLAAQGLLGYGNNNTSRSISLYGSRAKASYGSWFTNLRTQLGWNYDAIPNLVMTPLFDASYLFVNQGSYRESGSVMDLLVASNNNSSMVLGVYGNAAYHFTTDRMQYMTLSGYVGAARNVLNSEPQTTATFVAGGPSFSTFGVRSNQTVFRGGVGLNIVSPTQPIKVNINYDAQVGNNAYSGIGSVTASYQF